eukprot:COSAG01_NODE_52180_length_348_cov_1.228916_1_plen_24_part_01
MRIVLFPVVLEFRWLLREARVLSV